MQLQYIFSEVSHVGNVRAKNEDSCKAIKTINGHLFIVCDGMGGAAEGKKASSLAVDSIIAFFNKEPGRGTWEVFAKWLYGSAKDAPSVSFPEVGGNEETRNKVSSTRGALSQLSSSWADGKKVFALAITREDGTTVLPTNKNIASHKYPMSRPLFLLTNGEPQAEAKTFVEFVLSMRGQELVRKHGYLSLDQLK